MSNVQKLWRFSFLFTIAKSVTAKVSHIIDQVQKSYMTGLQKYQDALFTINNNYIVQAIVGINIGCIVYVVLGL